MKLHRERYPWKIRTEELTLGGRTLIMGALDVADPAAEGGARKTEELFQRGMAIQEGGADLLDVSAQWAGKPPRVLSPDEELRRLVPLLRKLRRKLQIPLSIQTCHAQTADRTLELGAEIINDWSGLSYDPGLARVVNQSGAGLVLGHARGDPDSWAKARPLPNLMGALAKDLDSAMARAGAAGIDRRRIVIDPGLEQGKRGSQNLQILVELDRLAALRRPILVSPSRKAFLTESVRSSEAQKLFSTTAAVTVAVCAGAHIVRVYETQEALFTVRATDRFLT